MEYIFGIALIIRVLQRLKQRQKARGRTLSWNRIHGNIRNDCLNQVIVLNESHLKRILSSYFDHYHNDRAHPGLDKGKPFHRSVQAKPEKNGKVFKLKRVGGLHHRYEWKDAA